MLFVMSVSFECHFLSTNNLLVISLTDFRIGGLSAIEAVLLNLRIASKIESDVLVRIEDSIRTDTTRFDITECKSKH